MTDRSDPEIKGNFLSHPFAELLAEIAAARLNGSLRVSNKDRKCVIYFKGGKVVFAVSNARSSRLFDILLTRNKIAKEDLARIPNFQNDFELTAHLKEKGTITNRDADELFTEQIESILVEILGWEEGDWAFSHLARVRDGLDFNVNVISLLVDYGRCVPDEKVLKRFRSLDESFSRAPVPEMSVNLTTEESFVLSRAVMGALSASELLSVSAISQESALHAIYTLWLGGFLTRTEWQAAFSPEIINLMRSARLEIKREAKMPSTVDAPEASAKTAESEAEPEKVREAEIELSLEDFLKRIDDAENYYDILGVEPDADSDELKRHYFALARKFHPDRYHAQGGAVLERVQHAFSELAQAHETLKNPESREVYDFRIRKELNERQEARAAGETSEQGSMQFTQALESFDRGFGLLMEGEAEAAAPFLARAAHYAPTNARYRAYYGKALSADAKQRHKAEAEMQAALKIDPNNEAFRLLLVEFYIHYNLPKRAEGELNRLLALFPQNREARELLESLKVK